MPIRVGEEAERMLKRTVKNPVAPDILKKYRVEERVQRRLKEYRKTCRELSAETLQILINS